MAEHKSIAAALCAAQQEMGKAIKDANNPHFKSKYADLGNVMDACLPALNKNGIAVFQPFHTDEGGHYVKTVFLHGSSGESLECAVPLIVGKHDMQGFGSAATYARRYGLMAMAGIAPEDDDGNAAAAAAPKPRDDAAAVQAVAYLGEADTLDHLRERWGKLPKAAQSIPAVIKAKDAKKAALEASPPPAADLDDEIPDFGGGNG